jgi:hypothetical protein
MDHAQTLMPFQRFQLSFEAVHLLFAQTDLSTASILLVTVKMQGTFAAIR